MNEAHVKAMRDLLIECRDQFVVYEKHHMQKARGATFNGMKVQADASLDKAAVNRALAARIDRVLSGII